MYGCRAPATPRVLPAAFDMPHDGEAVGRQLAAAGLTFTRDVIALTAGTMLGLAFWDLMDTHGGLFFVAWFLLGMAYLLYWPFFRARGWVVTVLHAFFLGPLVQVVVPLEFPAVFALLAGLTMMVVGLALLLYAWSPAVARVALIAAGLAAAFLYRPDGRSVTFWVDRSGPEQPVTAPWPPRPVVLSGRASVQAWRVGGYLERLQEIGVTGYGTLSEARWASELGHRISGLAARRQARHPMFTRAELSQMLRDPELGAVLGLPHHEDTEERLVVIPWWGERAPEVVDVVRAGRKIRVMVELSPCAPPFTDARSSRRFHRCVVAIPAGTEDVEVQFRAPGSWLLGHRLALRVAGYEASSTAELVDASPADLDADWMLRRLSPVLELYDGVQ